VEPERLVNEVEDAKFEEAARRLRMAEL